MTRGGRITVPIRPSKFQLELLEKTLHPGTDMMSFKLGRKDIQQGNHFLDYKGGQYAAMDLETKEDAEGPVRSFTIASSPTEEEFILISTKDKGYAVQKETCKIRNWGTN